MNSVQSRKVISLPSPPRFLTISEDGAIIYWSNKLKLIEKLLLDELQFRTNKSLKVTDVRFLGFGRQFALEGAVGVYDVAGVEIRPYV
jgi:hypothetical protein